MAYAKPLNNSYYLYTSQGKYVKPLGKITKQQADKIKFYLNTLCDKLYIILENGIRGKEREINHAEALHADIKRVFSFSLFYLP